MDHCDPKTVGKGLLPLQQECVGPVPVSLLFMQVSPIAMHAGKCLNTWLSAGGAGRGSLVAFADFCDGDIPTIVNVKLPTECH